MYAWLNKLDENLTSSVTEDTILYDEGLSLAVGNELKNVRRDELGSMTTNHAWELADLKLISNN